MAEKLTDIAAQIRRDIIRMVYSAQSGHPGGSLGCADFFAALYFRVMKRDTNFTMHGIGEDLFFLSNGHISPVFYATLARAGYFPITELGTFRKINTRLQGHPTTHDHLPGVRIASGSLGQGISVACGAAEAKKLNNDDSTVFVLTGDGELDEGQNWEAIMFAPNRGLDNLVWIIDRNHQQIDGSTEQVMNLDNLTGKLEAFNWEVQEIDGHDMHELVSTLENAKKRRGRRKPVAIIMHTVMGKGVSFMEGTHEWHGIAPNEQQLRDALAELPEALGDY